MSEYGYCPRGGMEGIRVSDEELNEFAEKRKSQYLDDVIPLPNVDEKTQLTRLNEECKHDPVNAEYFERDNGSHGWCCGYCGTVVQWG